LPCWTEAGSSKPSVYGGWAAHPLQYRGFKGGAAVGFVTGYPLGDVRPMLALVGSYDSRQYGITVVITPPLGSLGAGWADGGGMIRQ